MPQSLANVTLHIIFSTKHRQPFLFDPKLRDELAGYLVGTLKNIGCPSIITGVVKDHIHVLCNLSRTITIANLVEELKTSSSAFEVARFESREATSADSLGRKPKDLLEIVRLAAKRRQQSARQQFAAAASRLSESFQHFSAGLRPQLSTVVASRLNSATSKSSAWVKETAPKHSDFYWQSGYGAFSVSHRTLRRSVVTSPIKKSTTESVRFKRSTGCSCNATSSYPQG